MNKLYECYHCDIASDEDQWNKKTQNEHGIKIVHLNNNTDLYSTSFVCPNCSDINDTWMMKRINQ